MSEYTIVYEFDCCRTYFYLICFCFLVLEFFANVDVTELVMKVNGVSWNESIKSVGLLAFWAALLSAPLSYLFSVVVVSGFLSFFYDLKEQPLSASLAGF